MLSGTALALILAACGTGPDAEAPPSDASGSPATARRMIEPRSGRSTADLMRVQIGTETRTVVSAQPQVVLLWQSPVSVEGDLDLAIAIPPALRGAGALLVEARVSIEDPAMRDAEGLELAKVVAPRRTFESERVLVDGTDPDAPIEVRIEIDPEANADLLGATGLVDLVARPLGDAAAGGGVFDAVDVAPGDVLRFGYAVEMPATAPGWPPVRFRVSARAVDAAGEAKGEPVVLFERSRDPAQDPRDRGWHDARVPLDAFAGQRVRIGFEATAVGEIGDTGLARSLPVFNNPVVVPGPLGPAAHRGPRNVILISLDTLRAVSMSAYGHDRETTPVFDARVAGEGALVLQAVTPFPFSPPSHMSMLTGLDVCAHGVENRDGVLAADRVTLAEALRAAGYRTAAFTEDAYVVAGAGFARGFDTYFELQSEEHAAPGFAPETFDRAADFLADVDARPFFLFVHTYQVHSPYTPPRAYRSLFRDAPGDPRTRAHARALDDYEREVRYTDALLGDFIDALEARGLGDDTILVVTSDHGEQFGEHFFTGHGMDLHDEALRVPLGIRAPGLVPEGTRLDLQVGLFDLAPTLLALLDVEPLEDVQGRSFAAALLGAPDDTAAFEARPLIGRASHSRSVRMNGFKYLVGTAASSWEKLYALGPDPDEVHDVAAENPAPMAAARAALAAHDAACEAWRRDHPAPEGAGQQGHTRPAWMINRDEIERKLRSLGYVE